jgi:hypothetical protein
MTEVPFTEAELAQFTGSTTWYRHGLNRNITYTDGIQHLAERAGAYWLIDEVVLAQKCLTVKREEFQVWRLIVNTLTHHGELTCDDGNGNIVFREDIPFTNFPFKDFRFYFTRNVILLTTEY